MLALLASGCFEETVEPGGSRQPGSTSGGVRPTVIAVIDDGLNPYHKAFWGEGHDATVDAHLPWLQPATLINLTRASSYEASIRADSSLWGGVEHGQLVAFSGSPLMYMDLSRDAVASFDRFGHGTGTTYVVLEEAPHALTITVKVDAALCIDKQPSCLIEPSVADAMEWAAEQPWIDIVTLSLNVHGNAPDRPEPHPEMARFVQASRRAAEQGKIVVNSAGNWVLPPTVDYLGGLPWTIAVGGVVAQNRGDALLSSKGADLVSDFVVFRPEPQSLDAMDWHQGTSYAAPKVAGILAEALYRVRQNLSHVDGILPDATLASGTASDGREIRVTSQMLRDALNATGSYFSATAWEPALTVTDQSHPRYVNFNAPVVAPFVQMGWGYADGNATEAIVARVLAGNFSIPSEKAAAAQYQAAVQAAREAYWSRST